MKPGFPMEQIFGGALLGIKSREFVCFYDWGSATLVRRIDVTAKSLYWSDTSDQVSCTAIPAAAALHAMLSCDCCNA